LDEPLLTPKSLADMKSYDMEGSFPIGTEPYNTTDGGNRNLNGGFADITVRSQYNTDLCLDVRGEFYDEGSEVIA